MDLGNLQQPLPPRSPQKLVKSKGFLPKKPFLIQVEDF